MHKEEGGSEEGVSLLLKSLPWLLPTDPPTRAHRRLLPLLLGILVHSPATVPLAPSALSTLVQVCAGEDHAIASGPPGDDGSGVGSERGVADGAGPSEAGLVGGGLLVRALCVAFNKWASDALLDATLGSLHTQAAAGQLGALRLWIWIGRVPLPEPRPHNLSSHTLAKPTT